MKTPVLPAATPSVPSPCIGVCKISAQTGWCEGCFRRLEEIGCWASMSADEKHAVWQRIEARAATLKGTVP